MDDITNNELTKSQIEDAVEQLTLNDKGHKYHCFKKMDAVFKYIQESISYNVLSDRYLTEYLSAFIEEYGMANSKQYINTFYSICKTDNYKSEIKELCNSIIKTQKNHKVEIYKTVNGYHLSAHLFYPSNLIEGEKLPSIAIFHGGGWAIGNPSWAFGQARLFQNKGMIGVAVQYRLANKIDISPLDSMQDAKDLIKWLRANSDLFGIQNDKIAAAGWSAGAHLATSCAVFPDYDKDNRVNSIPDALLLTSPSVDLSDDFEDEVTKLLAITDIDPLSVSPVEFITEGLPPTIILQGREDNDTHLEGVQLFHDKMRAKNNYSEICIFDNVGHLFTPSYLDDTGWPQTDMEVQMKADLKAIGFLRKFGFIKQIK